MAQEGWNVEASSDSIDQCQQQQNQNQNNDGVLLHCSNNSAVFGISDASMNLCTNCFSERQGGEIDPPFPPSDLASKAMRNKDLPSVCSEKSCVSSAKKLGVVSLASKEAGKDKCFASSKKRPLPSDEAAFDSVNSENVERSMKTFVLSAEAKDKSDMVCVLNSQDSSAFVDFTQTSYLRTIDYTAQTSSSNIDAIQRVLPSSSRKIFSSSSLSCVMAGSDGACVASVIASEGSSTVDSCSPISRRDHKTMNCSDHRAVKRCFICKKRAGLLGFKCRCGDIFCAQHRHSVKHSCPYDYKAAAKDAIAKANPLVRASKIQRI